MAHQKFGAAKTLPALLFAASLAIAAVSINITAQRISDQPLISPGARGTAWSRFALFNPAAVKLNGKTILLFRAQGGNHVSSIGYAESNDGVHFTVRPEPVLSPQAGYEIGGGVEDPRVIEINATFYMTYTGYNGKDAQLCLATSADLIHWQRKGVIMPAYKGAWNTKWTKSGAILREKINGKYWMWYLGTKKDSDGKLRDYMGIAASNDLLAWTDATSEPVLPRRPNAFDSRVMEPGPPPFVVDSGILLFYNGANENLVYAPGWVLFDKHDPRHVVARSEDAFISPALSWEKTGNVPNVIFLEGAVASGPITGTRRFELVGYYGGADKYIGAMRIGVSLPQH